MFIFVPFTVKSECPGRSGVNLTRRDFEKLGKVLTTHLNVKSLDLSSNYEKNFFKAATEELLEGSFEKDGSDFTSLLVESLMTLRAQANTISKNL